MSSRPFLAILPRPLQIDDEIVIKGKTKEDANEFSINFTIDISPHPSFIAYHFKTVFDANVVVQNHKDKCVWNGEERSPNEWINAPGDNFALAFVFQDSDILVYSLEDEDSRNLIYTFAHRLDFDLIQTVQAWGDVEKITELSFRFS